MFLDKGKRREEINREEEIMNAELGMMNERQPPFNSSFIIPNS
jgi:hypothetical protein